VFPLGCATGCFQAAVEAETDLDCLLATLPKTREWRRRFLLPYVAVALLALTDVLDQLAGRTIGVARKKEPVSFDRLCRANESFRRACDLRGIRMSLNREVRNRVAAHRVQQSVESHGQAHDALTDRAFPSMITAARRLLWTMQTVRVWYWGRSGSECDVVIMRCRTRNTTTLRYRPKGLEAPSVSNYAGPQALGEDDVAEEFSVGTARAGADHANRFWEMQDQALYCCGRPYKDR
jgi:hypothetical protein